MTHSTSPAAPSNAEKPPSDKNIEQAKAAVENVREGYGSTIKSSHISGKPDGDALGGPGANNQNATKPIKP